MQGLEVDLRCPTLKLNQESRTLMLVTVEISTVGLETLKAESLRF